MIVYKLFLLWCKLPNCYGYTRNDGLGYTFKVAYFWLNNKEVEVFKLIRCTS